MCHNGDGLNWRWWSKGFQFLKISDLKKSIDNSIIFYHGLLYNVLGKEGLRGHKTFNSIFPLSLSPTASDYLFIWAICVFQWVFICDLFFISLAREEG